jgi:hypothetical protein
MPQEKGVGDGPHIAEHQRSSGPGWVGPEGSRHRAAVRARAWDDIRAWLRSKECDVARFDEGDPRVGSGAVVLHSPANSADGFQTWRWQLCETKDDGAWLSSLVVHAPAQAVDIARCWFWVEVEFAPADGGRDAEQSTRAAVPKTGAACWGGSQPMIRSRFAPNEPAVTSRDGVDELIDVLCDPDRRLPAVVVARATRCLPRLASICLLDPLAASECMETASAGCTRPGATPYALTCQTWPGVRRRGTAPQVTDRGEDPGGFGPGNGDPVGVVPAARG